MSIMAAGASEDTVRVGLLMEATQAQQTLAATALEHLREHTAGLDAIVRQEIHSTMLEEMQALGEDSQRAAVALRTLQRVANLRLAAWGVGILSLSAVIPFVIAWYLLPTPADLAALRARRDELAGNVARLAREGGTVELRHCGAAQRLCVRVDRGAPAYGDGAEFLVVKGH
jgi:hypothetical protein